MIIASKNYFYNNKLVIRKNTEVFITHIDILDNDEIYFTVSSDYGVIRLYYIDIYETIKDGWDLTQF